MRRVSLLLLLTLLGGATAGPCQLVVSRTPESGLAPLYTFVFALHGPCPGVAVVVGLRSEIGGDYPAPPPTVTPAQAVRLTGNLPWWKPVKLTSAGPVFVPYRENP